MNEVVEWPNSAASLVFRTGGDPTKLSALLDLHGHPSPEPRDVQWRSNLDGDLGVGFTVTMPLSAGTHSITASCPDGIGGTLQEVAIIVGG